MGSRLRAGVVVVAAALTACSRSIPTEPAVREVDTSALAELVIGAESICDQQAAAGGEGAGGGVPVFDQVRLLGGVPVPPGLRSSAHDLWWRRYLAVRRASALMVLDAARSSSLPSQQEDAIAWRDAAAAFEESLAGIGEVATTDADTMFAAAQAAEAKFSGAGSRLLGEVERRLAGAVGIVSCNRPVLQARLRDQVGDDDEYSTLVDMADVLVGPTLAVQAPSEN